MHHSAFHNSVETEALQAVHHLVFFGKNKRWNWHFEVIGQQFDLLVEILKEKKASKQKEFKYNDDSNLFCFVFFN